MLRVSTTAFLAIICFAPLTAASWDAHAPVAVVAAAGPETAVVSFVVGVEMADYYNVYGVTWAGGFVELARVVPDAAAETLDVLVPSAYEDYAVSGVLDGRESERVVTGFYTPCLVFALNPPPPDVYPKDPCPDPSKTFERVRGPIQKLG